MKKIFVLLIAMIIASLSISTAYASRGSGTITSNGRVIASVYKGIHNKTTKYGLPTY